MNTFKTLTAAAALMLVAGAAQAACPNGGWQSDGYHCNGWTAGAPDPNARRAQVTTGDGWQGSTCKPPPNYMDDISKNEWCLQHGIRTDLGPVPSAEMCAKSPGMSNCPMDPDYWKHYAEKAEAARQQHVIAAQAAANFQGSAATTADVISCTHKIYLNFMVYGTSDVDLMNRCHATTPEQIDSVLYWAIAMTTRNGLLPTPFMDAHCRPTYSGFACEYQGITRQVNR
jgi:hypothetical protein